MRAFLCVAFAAQALSCAPTDYAWKSAVHFESKQSPSRFATRNGSELWAIGPVPARMIAGRWEKVDLCGGQTVSEVAFEGNTIWAYCGSTLVRYADETKAEVVSFPNDGATIMMPIARGFLLVGQTKVFGMKDGAIVPLFPISRDGFTDPAPGCGVAIDDLYRVKASAVEHWDGTAWSAMTFDAQGSNSIHCDYRDGHAYSGEYELARGVATRIAGNDDTKKRNLAMFSVIDGSTSVYYGHVVDIDATFSNGTSSASGDDVPAAKAFLWSWNSGKLEYLGGAPMNFGGLYGGSGTTATFALEPDHVFLLVGNDILEGRR
jgi:hypothetical protein